MPLVLAALLAAGLIGLVLVRSAPAAGRVLAAMALCALAVAAFDPALVVRRDVPADVVLLATKGSAPELEPLRERARQAKASVREASAQGSFADRLTASALRAGPRPGELLAVWNGPAGDAPSGLRGAAASVVPPLPFDPAAVKVVANGPLAVGRPALLEVSGPATGSTLQAELVLRDAKGAEVQRSPLELTPGGAATIRWLPAVAGELALELRVRGGDTEIVRRGQLTVIEPLPVLVVDHTGVAAAALRAQGIAVNEVATLPQDLTPFAAAVLFDEVPAADQQRVVDAEADGLGLLVAGPALLADGFKELLPVRLKTGVVGKTDGEGTGTGPGAEQGEPQSKPPDEPVEPKPPDPQPQPAKPPVGNTEGAKAGEGPMAEVERRSVAIVLVVDRSGSMGDQVPGTRNSKMSYAKTSVQETARALAEGDLVGIVTFGNRDGGRIDLPLTDANDRKAVDQAVQRLAHASEQTYLLSGLQRAREMLAAKKLPVRHVVVVSDGEIVLDEDMALTSLARQLKREGITVSIVQIAGGAPNPFQAESAEKITRTGGGRYLPIGDASRVPVFVSAEVVSSLAKVGRQPAGEEPGPGSGPGPEKPPDPAKAAEEPKPPDKPMPPQPQPEPPVATSRDVVVRAVADSELLRPVPVTGWPSLRASLPCEGTLDALVLLVAGNEGHPLLAFGNRGLGRVAAFTANLASADCAAFRAEPSFPARLAQWLQTVRRPDAATTPADLLQPGFQVQPLRPAPAEVAALEAATGASMQPLEGWQPPAPRLEVGREGQAATWALPAALLLVLLVAGEWALARLRPHG